MFLLQIEWPLLDIEPDDDFDFLGSSSDEDGQEEDEILLQRSDSDVESSENPGKISDETLSSLNTSFLFQSSERDLEDLKRFLTSHYIYEINYTSKELEL